MDVFVRRFINVWRLDYWTRAKIAIEQIEVLRLARFTAVRR